MAKIIISVDDADVDALLSEIHSVAEYENVNIEVISKEAFEDYDEDDVNDYIVDTMCDTVSELSSLFGVDIFIGDWSWDWEVCE